MKGALVLGIVHSGTHAAVSKHARDRDGLVRGTLWREKNARLCVRVCVRVCACVLCVCVCVCVCG